MHPGSARPAARRSSRLRAAVRRDRRRRGCGRRRGAPRQDQHGRVRDGLVHRELRHSVPRATPGISTACPAARRRVGRGGGRRRGGWALGTDTGRLGPAARRVLRRRRAEADVRPGVALRADRLRVLAGQVGTVRAQTCADAALLLGASPATIRATRPRSTCRCPTIDGDLGQGVGGSARRRARRVLRRRASIRRSSRGARSGRSARAARRADRARVAAARRVRRSPPTTSSRPRRRRRTSRATTACGTGCASPGERADSIAMMSSARAARASAPR